MSLPASTIILATYHADEVLSMVRSGYTKKYVFNERVYHVKMYSKRYSVFKKSRTCAICGLIGTEMALCVSTNMDCAHFNLIGYTQKGQSVLFTKDHIVPVSKGGNDSIDNLRTMCCRCNQARGNNTDLSVEDILALADTQTSRKEKSILRYWHHRLKRARKKGLVPPKLPGSAPFKPPQQEQEKSILDHWHYRLEAARKKGLVPHCPSSKAPVP